jgi:hypothetical protein
MSERPDCPFCDQNTLRSDDERAMQACRECADKIGLIPMPPARRPAAPCMRCSHMKFVRVIPREHSSSRGGDWNTQVSAPMYVTHAPTQNKGFFSSTVNELQIEKTGVGMLEVYICKKCGFVEWYCLDAEKLTAHPHLMSEDVDYDAGQAGPYR